MASLQPKSGPLGRRLATHLLRRTTFRYTKDRIEAIATMTADQAVDQLMLIPAPSLAEPIDPQTGQPWINSGSSPGSPIGALRDFVKSWWVHEALLDSSIGHKMMLFLHSNFVVAASQGTSQEYFDYLALLRFYALGNIKTLARKITLDNQMLRYLDNTTNNKNNPNENFAREFFELFTIGKGPQIAPGDYTHFTEADIATSARLLSGFKVRANRMSTDPDTGIPMGYANILQHDAGDKTFSNAFQQRTITGRSTAQGMFEELEEWVDMIFDQPETPKAICRKLYRFFVSPRITTEIENDIITPLAQTMISQDFQLEPVMKQLLKSAHFYDEDDADASDEIIGALMRSPLELILHPLNYFQVAIPDPLSDTLNHYQRFYMNGLIRAFFPLTGMDLFRPSDVAGYPAYYQEPDYQKNWFNASTIIARYQLPEMLLTGRRLLYNQPLGAQLDIVAYVENHISSPQSATILVEELLQDLLPEAADPDRFAFYRDYIFLDQVPLYDWTKDWQAYEQSGDDSEIRPPLERLVTALLYSQEFQAM